MRNKLRKISSYFTSFSPAFFFAACATLFFIIYNLVTPPLQAPDELNHLYRIYQLSEGDLVAEKKDQRVGGSIPYSVSDFALPCRLVATSEHKINSDDFHRLLSQPEAPQTRVFRDFPNTAQYNIVSYFPQVTAFVFLRFFKAPVIIQYYGARLAVFLCWAFMIYYSIKLIPLAKWLIVLLALLPMNLFLSNSLSADSVTNGLAFLLLSYTLKISFAGRKATKRELIVLAVICFLLALAKIVYTPLVLLVLLIPAAVFRSQRYRKLYCVAILFISIVCALAWSAQVLDNYIPDYDYNPLHRNDATIGFHADMAKQKQYILQHPLYFPGVILNTIFNSPKPYLKSYIATFGAFQDTDLPSFFSWILWPAILICTLFAANQFVLTWKQRVLMVISSVAALVCVLLSQHLTWDQVGSGVVELMQGRYLIPLIPVLLLSLSGLTGRHFHMKLLVILLVLTINCAAVQTLFKRYIRVPYQQTDYFYSSFEKLNKEGNFLTSDPRYTLSADNYISNLNVRTGHSAVISSPQFPYLLGCAFSNISGGDLIEIEMWKKGKGASLVLNGRAKECGDIYMANNYPDYTDYRGWEHVHMHYKVPGKCSDFDLHFLIHNPGNSVVYIDDISFTIRRGRTND